MRSITLTVVASAAFLVAACGGSPTGPQEQMSNEADNFSFQLSNVSNYSSDREFTWQNTGTIANVTQSSDITAGTARLVIKDAADNEVYSANLGQSGTFQTAVGTPGNWRIDIEPSAVSGTLNFRVQRGG